MNALIWKDNRNTLFETADKGHRTPEIHTAQGGAPEDAGQRKTKARHKRPII
jgi:hypothetical protein